jgi:homoserine O-succinyltransferase
VLLLSGEFTLADFPEQLISKTLNNTWGNATNVIINNWIGCVYQVTHEDILLQHNLAQPDRVRIRGAM